LLFSGASSCACVLSALSSWPLLVLKLYILLDVINRHCPASAAAAPCDDFAGNVVLKFLEYVQRSCLVNYKLLYIYIYIYIRMPVSGSVCARAHVLLKRKQKTHDEAEETLMVSVCGVLFICIYSMCVCVCVCSNSHRWKHRIICAMLAKWTTWNATFYYWIIIARAE